MRTMLIYGATGKAGRLVMERALDRGWAVAAFVRNPDKVPEALRATIETWSVAAMAWVIRNVAARKAWAEAEAEAWVRWCFEGAPPAFRFVYARLGQMVEQPSRGTLRAEPTENNIQHGSASYCDVADALVKLAGDAERTWERKPLFFNYADAAGSHA